MLKYKYDKKMYTIYNVCACLRNQVKETGNMKSHDLLYVSFFC